jgi:hypothetical protein
MLLARLPTSMSILWVDSRSERMLMGLLRDGPSLGSERVTGSPEVINASKFRYCRQSARNYRALSANFTQDIEMLWQDNVLGGCLRRVVPDCRFMCG